MVDHLGKPNLIGFMFGEPLFTTNPLDREEAESEAPAPLSPPA
jgi:hypothetical protein